MITGYQYLQKVKYTPEEEEEILQIAREFLINLKEFEEWSEVLADRLRGVYIKVVLEYLRRHYEKIYP